MDEGDESWAEDHKNSSIDFDQFWKRAQEVLEKRLFERPGVQFQSLMENISEVFEEGDINGDGLISKEEMFKFLNMGRKNEIPKEIIDQMFRTLDLDGNESISFSEFTKMSVAINVITEYFE